MNKVDKDYFDLEAIEQPDVKRDSSISGGFVREFSKYTPLMLTVAKGDENLDCLKLILQHGADFRCKDENSNTLLHIAAMNNNIKMLDYLAKNLKIDIFERNKQGETALNICQKLKNEKGIALLLQYQGQYDESKNTAAELMNELCKEEEESEEAKAKRKAKKWRNKINRIAKAEGIKPEEVEARL